MAKRYSGKDLAERLRVHPRTVRRWRVKGVAGVKLRPTQIGGRVFYRGRDVKAFLREVREAKGVKTVPAGPMKVDRLGDEQAKAYLRARGLPVGG
jgi:hypothetical protein